ncbi:MAG: hypothetical protein ACW99G_09655 [Candidatus Thorarchaeota archaeon]|jgi:hypothetical protein
MNSKENDDIINVGEPAISWVGKDGIKKMETGDLMKQLIELDKLFDVKSLQKIEATMSEDESGKVGFQFSILSGGKSKGGESGIKFTLERK